MQAAVAPLALLAFKLDNPLFEAYDLGSITDTRPSSIAHAPVAASTVQPVIHALSPSCKKTTISFNELYATTDQILPSAGIASEPIHKSFSSLDTACTTLQLSEHDQFIANKPRLTGSWASANSESAASSSSHSFRSQAASLVDTNRSCCQESTSGCCSPAPPMRSSTDGINVPTQKLVSPNIRSLPTILYSDSDPVLSDSIQQPRLAEFKLSAEKTLLVTVIDPLETAILPSMLRTQASAQKLSLCLHSSPLIAIEQSMVSRVETTKASTVQVRGCPSCSAGMHCFCALYA